MRVELGLNAPQLAAHKILFGGDGLPRRGISLLDGWGRGVGKSWYRRQVWWLLVAALDYKLRSDALEPFRGVRIRCLAPTLKQWKLINWDGILEELTPGGKWAWLGAKLDTSTGQIRFPGGSMVTPFPAMAYNARTAKGMRADVLDADEYDDIDAAVYDAVAVPWLSEPWSLRIELLAGTPTRGRHGLWWRALQAGRLGDKLRASELSDEEALKLPEVVPIAEKFGDNADPTVVLDALRSSYAIHATYKDVPETVSPFAVAKARANTLPATFEREWEANADAGEGLVYPFDDTFHVREPPPLESFREFLVGMDHGWVDLGVLLLGGIQGHGDDAVLWLLAESAESEVPNHVWNERAKLWNFAKFWPDPSRPDRINDLRSAGLSIGHTDNDLMGGIGRVADLLFIRSTDDPELRSARLYVSPECRHTIREFGLYRRKKLADGTFDEAPEDKNNHTMDALRYMAVGRFGRAANRKQIASGR